MIHAGRKRTVIATLITLALLLSSFGLSVFGQRHRRPHYYRRSHTHHSRTKGALIGGAAGVIGGALIGKGAGALIGGPAGVGAGILVQHIRNKKH
jgi:hypothetical protein